jgi:hypothetical protein
LGDDDHASRPENIDMLKLICQPTESKKLDGEWLLRASAALFECVPDISVNEAIAIARQLRRTNPRLSPENAVATFIVPVDEFGLAMG